MKRILLLGLVIANINAMELVNARAVSSKDEALKLYTNQKEFYVEDENAAYRVEAYEMNKELRDLLKYKALAKFIDSESGYIRIKKEEGDDTYALDAKVRGLGAGPISGACVYVGIKTAAYTAMILGGMGAQAAAPGAGTVVVGIALGTGGMAGALAATEAVAVKWGCAAFLVPWLP